MTDNTQTKEKECPWVKDSYDREYHDNEWGRPEHDDTKLFELLILEGFQAGLSWNIILKKRDHMREVFDGFDALKIVCYDDDKKAELLGDSGIIRNRRKIDAVIANAAAFLKIKEQYGSFDSYIWSFVDNEPIVNAWTDIKDMPARTELSDKMSKELKKKGFKFVGSTICYSFMQATGMINDHVVWCHRYKELKCED